MKKNLIILLLAPIGFSFADKTSILPMEEPTSPFSGSISFGYESTYLFRGVDFGDHAPWAGLDLNYDFAPTWSLNTGLWYINPTQNPSDFDELDLYAFVSKELGKFTLSAGGYWYYFPENNDDAPELGLSLGYKALDSVDLTFYYGYDFNTDGSYFQYDISKKFKLTDKLSAKTGVGISHGSSYYGVSGGNHVFTTFGLDYALTETLTLSAYIGGNFPIADLADLGEDDDVHGGVSASVSF